MLALKSVQDILRFMGLLMESDKKYSLYNVKNVLITVPMVVLLLPLCGYFVFNVNNLLNATDVFYVIAATILCIGQYWFLVAQKRPLAHLLSELQALIDQREGKSCLFYKFVQVERQVYLFTKQMKAFVTFASTICLFLPCIFAAVRFITGKYTHNDWYLPYKFKVPFDDSTLVGYTVCYCIQLSGSASICAIIYTVNSLFFGVCWYIRSLLFDLTTIFDQINDLYAKENNNENPTKNESKCHQLLRKYVQTHIGVIRFIEDFGNIMSGIIFVTFVISVLWLCTSVYQIHAHISNMSYLLLQSIMTTNAIVLIIFIMCYFGQSVTTDCAIPAHSLYNNELWYRFPIKLQKSMIIIIERSQHSYVFTAFKMYRCTLNSFTTIINSAFQVFMLFRSISSNEET